MDREILKGSIDIIILSIISRKDTYGYEIAKKINSEMDTLYDIGEGTLYTALKRLENKKLINSYWDDIPGGKKRKYYQISDAGLKVLGSKIKDWKCITSIIDNCMEGI